MNRNHNSWRILIGKNIVGGIIIIIYLIYLLIISLLAGSGIITTFLSIFYIFIGLIVVIFYIKIYKHGHNLYLKFKEDFKT